MIHNVVLHEVSTRSQLRLKLTFKVVFEVGKTLRLESAATSFQQSLGMRQREPLRPCRGMMFPLGRLRLALVYIFNCWAPLDIVFLKEGSIVDLSEKTPIRIEADSRLCPYCQSSGKVDHWPGFRLGTIQKMGLQVGDRVDLLLI